MTQAEAHDLNDARRARQRALVAAGTEIEIGAPDALPWPLDTLTQLRGDEPFVVARIDSGLTAVVFRLRGEGRDWALKCARPQALVENADGALSFLNEIECRVAFERLKRAPGGQQRWQAIVDTCYASLRRGLIVSPWIEGAPARDWDARRIAQVLDIACALWLEGLFEWDLSPGNVLDDGGNLRLFDFGYLYRFDPLQQFNSAGRGDDLPMFHPAERFETRNYSAHLLELEARAGMGAALDAFRLEKAIARERYARLHEEAAARGAQAHVLDWIAAIVRRWDTGLAGDLEALYRAEGWRSHMLDLEDDLSGRSCTPMTLRRADWLLEAIERHHDALRAADALLWDDRMKTREQLLAVYADKRAQAQRLQIGDGLRPAAPGNAQIADAHAVVGNQGIGAQGVERREIDRVRAIDGRRPQ